MSPFLFPQSYISCSTAFIKIVYQHLHLLAVAVAVAGGNYVS